MHAFIFFIGTIFYYAKFALDFICFSFIPKRNNEYIIKLIITCIYKYFIQPFKRDIIFFVVNIH